MGRFWSLDSSKDAQDALVTLFTGPVDAMKQTNGVRIRDPHKTGGPIGYFFFRTALLHSVTGVLPRFPPSWKGSWVRTVLLDAQVSARKLQEGSAEVQVLLASALGQLRRVQGVGTAEDSCSGSN